MFFLILIFALFFKANFYLLGFQILNPDEAQMISNAIGITKKGINFLEFDGTTSGLLNSIILTWPELFNLDITFLTTRITQVFLVSLIIFLLFRILYLQKNKISQIFILLGPITIFLLTTNDPDFSHYSSELLSTTILVLVYLLIKKDKEFSKKTTRVFAPTLLGLILFAKIQFFPVAIVTLLIILVEFYNKEKKISDCYIPLFYFLLPKIFFLTLLLLSGNLKDFLINNFLFAYDFISFSQSKNVLYEVFSSSKTYATKSVETGFKKHLLLNLVFHTIYAYFVFFLILFYKLIQTKNLKIFFNKDIIYSTCIILSLIFVILLPGKTHRHYLIAFLPFLPIFLSEVISSCKTEFKKINTKYFKILNYSLICLILFSSLLETKKFYSQKFDRNIFKRKNINFDSPKIFQYLFADNEEKKLYIWGWMPEWYVLSYMAPSSRETISEKQIIQNNQRNYYRNRLLNDLEKNKPDLLIDFVKEKSFRYNRPSQNLESFEKLKEFTYQNYVKLKKLNSDCPDYFLNNQDFKLLNSRLLPYKFKENNKDYLKLNDFSVTGDICDDAVNFSSSNNEILELQLYNASSISKIMILSSKANTKKIDVNASIHLNDSKIKEKNIKLNLFPFWTTLNVNEKIKINKIKLNIKHLRNNNGGINEIVIFKY